jgi:redox-sensitive bicupin YhaK (pirin superfamily)
MITVNRFETLGAFDNDWLSARHHFSFGHYHDPRRMGHGVLRVWNDDTIQPGSGFDPHGHRDMEIVTYVRGGAITHRDRLGNEGRTVAGDVQVMHAGTGIVHAEYNREDTATEIFQIWIEPDRAGHAPGWATQRFPKTSDGGFTVLASGRPDAIGGGVDAKGDGALVIHQDAAVLGATINAGETITYRLGAKRRGYMVPAIGRITVNGVAVNARDGVAIAAEETLTITAVDDAEIVLVDVP